MSYRSREKGLSTVSWIIVIAIFATVSTFLIKIFPVYLQYNSITHIMDNVVNAPELQGAKKKDIFLGLSKRFRTNSIYDKSLAPKNIITIKRDTKKKVYVITLDYEVRDKLVYNLDYVASFDYVVEKPY